MAITSFAAKEITYADGQNNKEPIPSEIIEHGFVPPVRNPDGSVSAGSKLAANHLNTLLNDIYTQMAEMQARIDQLENP